MTRRFHATAACVLALVGLPGPDRPEAGAAEPPTSFERALPIVAEVQRRFGDDARILSLEVWPAESLVEVQDPRNPEHVDGYTYRDGSLTDPEVEYGLDGKRGRIVKWRGWQRGGVPAIACWRDPTSDTHHPGEPGRMMRATHRTDAFGSFGPAPRRHCARVRGLQSRRREGSCGIVGSSPVT